MDQRLQNVFGRALKLRPAEIAALSETDTIHSVRNWDSMGHFLLVVELEKEYHTSISSEEAIRLATIALVVQLLQKKGVLDPGVSSS